ncbi:hypothetical protein GCM10007275_17910 [Jeotgalicoccus coquinae]|uniref:Lipoprotein n=1 Tax=Jeotgalicoccus coquinae TaxID=709509 RepID=A0A6V7RPN4_9STAP|nr:hypothetical protein [Jeotgalicoccus coquinae]MBB6424009.1 hypothetical protein [Jeotgalicoccus coquinae]GGE23210.1 hypothetical protein GCM10007275_17910 [Jeotgalicoccus coquinae]CAD2080099.1 hypothetical protein JEOCOQ751_01657 [Jeotgalicoccus coquinae]
MRYLKNFGLLLAVTGVLAACQDAKLENGEEAVSEETNVTATDEESAENTNRASTEEETSAAEPADIENIDEQEIEDDKLAAIVEKAEEIESYRAELNISAALDNTDPRDLNAEVFFINSAPPQLLLREFGEDRTISKAGKIYYNNNSEWIDVSESVDVNVLYSVTYDNAAASFAEIAPYMEREEKDDKAVYTYEGSRTDIYQTIESLVQVNFGKMEIESVDSTVEVTVDKENKLIEEIKFEAYGTDTQGTFELNGNAAFDTFNEVEEIEIPEVE